MVEYEQAKVEAPLMAWAKENENHKKLLKIYRRTNDIYDRRLNEKKEKVSEVTELLERLDSSDFLTDDPTEKKLRAVCKANALLRRGQIKADALEDPLKDYQTSCAILTPLRNDPVDFPDFLVHLNLGKFFRNMGMYLHRRDYHERALNEFKDILGNLGYKDTDWDTNLWKTYIWLEAAMNLSRTELHLYQIQDAKAHLWMICTAVSKVYTPPKPKKTSIRYDELLKSLFPAVEDIRELDRIEHYSPTKDLIHFGDMGDKLKKLESSKAEGCKSGKDILMGYSIQTLLQLGIAYRKSRDYNIARKFFSYLLVMYQTTDAKSNIYYNVDALNNYAVCLRKGGFKASCGILKKNDLPNAYGPEPDSLDPAEAYFLSSIMFRKPSKPKKQENGCFFSSIVFPDPSKANTMSKPTQIHLPPTTMKQMYYAILVSLCDGTCSASSICDRWHEGNYWAQDVLKKKSGKFYLPIRNRFAMLEMIRSFYKKSESRQDDLKVVEELIGKLLELNPGDREIKLLQGQLLQRQLLQQPEKAAEAVNILNALYREAPQLSRGTIGLKAYQNLGYVFLAQDQYSQAQSIFHQIQEANPRVCASTNNPTDRSLVQKLLLKDLPKADVVSAVDEGWCLMNMGEYSDAKKIFEEILRIYEAQDTDYDEKSNQPVARLGLYSETRIRNNLIECILEEYYQKLKKQDSVKEYPHNEANKARDLRKKPQMSSSALFGDIEMHLRRMKAIEPNNPIATRHQGYWNLAQKDYASAMAAFEKATANRYDDVCAHAGWVQAAYECFMRNTSDNDIQKQVTDRLQFISGPYALKSCAKLSKMVEMMALQLEGEIKQLEDKINTLAKSIKSNCLHQAACIPCITSQEETYNKYKKDSKEKQGEQDRLYRSIARISLGVLEEGYSLFDDLKENNNFSSLAPEKQGKILVILYQLYAQVQLFKEDHLYCPKTDEDYEKLVQYRAINHLKRYLKPKTEKEPGGRLSLWNTAYMNDDREGRCFLAVFKELAEEEQKQASGEAPEVTTEKAPKKVPRFSSLSIGSYFSQKELAGAGIRDAPKKEVPDDGNSSNTQKKSASDDNDNPSMFLYENVYTSSLSLEVDSIPMWISYADNANGCIISYAKDYLNLRKKRAMTTDVSLYSENEFPLYEVIYLNVPKEEGRKLNDSEDTTAPEEVKELWEKVCDLLQKLQELQECDAHSKDLLPVINGFVRACLSEVRFLVKHTEYAYEQEIRMIHYSKDHLLETDHSEIPRLYINLDREVHLKKVVLGPKVNPYEQEQLETWLMNTEKVDTVKHSDRHIR